MPNQDSNNDQVIVHTLGSTSCRVSDIHVMANPKKFQIKQTGLYFVEYIFFSSLELESVVLQALNYRQRSKQKGGSLRFQLSKGSFTKHLKPGLSSFY